MSRDHENACAADTREPATGACVHAPVTPSEPQPIKFSSRTTASWPPTPDVARCNVHRGTIPATGLGSHLRGPVHDQTCFESADAFGDGAVQTADPAGPPVGTAFY